MVANAALPLVAGGRCGEEQAQHGNASVLGSVARVLPSGANDIDDTKPVCPVEGAPGTGVGDVPRGYAADG